MKHFEKKLSAFNSDYIVIKTKLNFNSFNNTINIKNFNMIEIIGFYY